MTSHQLNRRLSALMPSAIPLSIAVAIPFPGQFGTLLPTIAPVFFAIISIGSSTLRVRSIVETLRHLLPLLLILGILHVVMPVIVWTVARLGFAGSPDIATGMVLEFLVPTASAGFVWIAICGGDLTLRLAAVFVNAVLTPVLLPFGVEFLTGAHVSVDSGELMRSMMVMVLTPSVLAVVFNEATGDRVSGRLIPWLQMVVKFGIVVVILTPSTRIAPIVRTLDPMLLVITGVIFLISLTGYEFGWLAARLMGQGRGVTVVMIYGSGMRNINADAVIAAAFFPAATMFPVIISTLFQQVTAALISLAIQRRLPEASPGNDREIVGKIPGR